jgi:pimeloyl-ACP methyl ester carboxylesterase
VGSGVAAGVVLEVARAVPDRVDGLVLLNPQIGNYFADERLDEGWREFFLGSGLLRFYYLANWELNPLLIGRRMSELTAVDAAISPEVVEAIDRPRRTVDFAAHYGRWYRDRLAGLHARRRPDLEALSTINEPTAILWGERDPTVVDTHLFAYAKHLPNAELFILSELGHYPQLEDPQTFADALSTALTWIEGGGGEDEQVPPEAQDADAEPSGA